MKLRLYILDRGNTWEIVQTNTVDTQTTNLEELDYIFIDLDSWHVFEYITENLRNGKQLLIPKYSQTNLLIDDIIIIDTDDEVELRKKLLIINIKDYIYNVRITRESYLDMHRFIILNNWMISQNFVITDENREEKYLEIITMSSELEDETEAEKLISNLEKYLNLSDKLKMHVNLVEEMDYILNQITIAETNQDVLDIYNTYMAQFS